jgi:hypothetical protein
MNEEQKEPQAGAAQNEENESSGMKDQSSEQQEVCIQYFKSNFFRVIHADGAWGGVSPRGDIHMAFYNERQAIPDTSKFMVSDQGMVKPEEFQASSEFVREVEVDIIFDLQTARSLRAWLNDRIALLENLIREAQAGGVKDAGKETANA